MKYAVVLKLEPDEAQRQALCVTMEAFNQGCQHVADVAYSHRTANKLALQPLVYQDLRSRFGLSSQMVVRAISKACEVYKADKNVHPKFEPYDAMIFDGRILSIKGLTKVSMLCLSGRQLIPFRFVGYQPARPDRTTDQADLFLQDSMFHLAICIDLPAVIAEKLSEVEAGWSVSVETSHHTDEQTTEDQTVDGQEAEELETDPELYKETYMSASEVNLQQQLVIANQQTILANHQALFATQQTIAAQLEQIQASQAALDSILMNQATIQANQERILANQERILSNHERLLSK